MMPLALLLRADEVDDRLEDALSFASERSGRGQP